MPSLQLCRSTGQKRQNWYDLVAYTTETTGSDHDTAVRAWLICSNRKFIAKNNIFVTVTLHNNLFIVIDSLTIFTSQIVHTPMY